VIAKQLIQNSQFLYHEANSAKCHIKGRPTTSDTVKATIHNLQRRTKRFTPIVARHWPLLVIPILQHFHGLGTRYMLTLMYC